MERLDPQKTHTRNTVYNSIGEGLWGFAMGFHNMNSVVPMFLAQLGASAFIIGLIPGGFILLVALPQVVSAILFSRSTRIRELNIGLHFAMAPIAFLMGLAFYYFGFTGNTGIMVYLMLWVVWSLGVGLLVPIWADFLASVSVSGRRGRFFGVTFTVNATMGMLGGFVLREILALETFSFPQNFGLAFLIMTAAILVGNVFFMFMKVIHPPVIREEGHIRWWRRLKRIYGEDKNFRTYIITRALAAATFMPLAFYGVDMQDRFDLPLSAAGTFTFFIVVGQAVSNIFFGYIGDHYGRKKAIFGFFLMNLLATMTAIFAAQVWMAYLTFIFAGMAFGAGQSSFMAFIYEFAGEGGDRKLYYAALDTAVAPFIVLYISLAGFMVETWGTLSIYMVSATLVSLGGLIFLLKVKSPQHA